MIISIILLISIVSINIYGKIKLNEHNSMFYYAVFGLYLKEKGLTKDEIMEERMKWAKYHNRIHRLLWPNLYKKGTITEEDFRGDIVKLMKDLDIE